MVKKIGHCRGRTASAPRTMLAPNVINAYPGILVFSGREDDNYSDSNDSPGTSRQIGWLTRESTTNNSVAFTDLEPRVNLT